jgi:phospholipase/carboxylesterase
VKTNRQLIIPKPCAAERTGGDEFADRSAAAVKRLHMAPWTRRELLTASTALVIASCRSVTNPDSVAAARVSARPHTPTLPLERGERRLGPSSGRGGILYVPATAAAENPVALFVMLHGAGGSAEGMRFTFAHAERLGAVVLAPESRDASWDVIAGAFGPDVAAISNMLEETFSRVQVDAAHITIGGFSDGASYALSLGLPNGTLFKRVIAFSPGFNAAPGRDGQPRIFISHGTRDSVLPIDVTSRRIVPQLRRAQYDVTYEEFDGPHTVPDAIAREAFDWAG